MEPRIIILCGYIISYKSNFTITHLYFSITSRRLPWNAFSRRNIATENLENYENIMIGWEFLNHLIFFQAELLKTPTSIILFCGYIFSIYSNACTTCTTCTTASLLKEENLNAVSVVYQRRRQIFL